MIPVVFEQTLTTKEFADYIGRDYHAARRLLIRHGGYLNIGKDLIENATPAGRVAATTGGWLDNTGQSRAWGFAFNGEE